MFSKLCLLAVGLVCLMLPLATVTAATPVTSFLSASVDTQPSPSLRRLIRQLWTEHPSVQAAEARLAAARSRVTGNEQPLYNPTLALDAERTDITITSVGLSQTLDWHDKRSAHRQLAYQEQLTAQFALAGVRQRMVTAILDALVQYTAARAHANMAQKRSQLMQRFVTTVAQRRKTGDMSALDLVLANLASNEAGIQQANSASRQAETRAALQALTGMQREDWPILPAVLPVRPQQAGIKALASLPALAVLHSRTEETRTRWTMVRRDVHPDPVIGFRVGTENSGILLGLSLEIPLRVRNDFQNELQALSHESTAASLAYQEALLRAQTHLKVSLQEFQDRAQAWESWLSDGQNNQRQQLRLLDLLWQSGELGASDYLMQVKQNIDTQTMAIQLKTKAWQAAIAWLDASGNTENWLGFTTKTVQNNIKEQ